MMSSKHLRGDINYVWPTAEVAVMGAQVRRSSHDSAIRWTYKLVALQMGIVGKCAACLYDYFVIKKIKLEKMSANH